MANLNLEIENYGTIKVLEKTKFYELMQILNIKNESIILAKLNDKCYELSEYIPDGGNLKWVYITETIAMKAYIKTLQFLMVVATRELFKDSKIKFEHSLGNSIFGEIELARKFTEEDLKLIDLKMKELINNKANINSVKMKKEEAIQIFNSYGWFDKSTLLKYSDEELIKVNELNGVYDTFYTYLCYNSDVIKSYELSYYEPGFLLKYPDDLSVNSIKEFKERKKLFNIFYETNNWGKILGVEFVSDLNKHVEENNIIDIIRTSEALQEKKIAHIADMVSNKKEARLILIAGPSSSGKTTFSKRLSIQLRVNGYFPVAISLDDYFVDRENTPKDEFGEYDFESINALDLQLFNEHLTSLLRGEEVEIPSFNFKTGKREWIGQKLRLPERGILVVEGIHGLNEMLTSSISHNNKFKIYISALTQLNLDRHNRISTTDARIFRRIVRDILSRGYSAETTLNMWNSIRRGEEKNIFPFQEEADIMFNSSLIYELSVLKPFAIEHLKAIKKESKAYEEAQRLIEFISFFEEIDVKMIPENSIVREFVGGSCFYKY